MLSSWNTLEAVDSDEGNSFKVPSFTCVSSVNAAATGGPVLKYDLQEYFDRWQGTSRGTNCYARSLERTRRKGGWGTNV